MKRLSVWTAALVAVLAARPARGDDEPPRILVHVAPSVGRAEADRLVSAVRGQLRGAARVTTNDDDSELAVAVGIDRNAAEQLVVRFSDPFSGQVLGERVVTHGGELGASEVGTIVRAFVVARSFQAAPAAPSNAAAAPVAAGGAPPALAPGAVEPNAGVDVERPRANLEATGVPWRARIGVFYTGSSYAGALPWQSGVRVAAAASLPQGLYASVAYAYFLPSEVVVRDVATVRVARHVGDACLGIEHGRGRLSVAADIGGGLAVDVRSTPSAGSGLSATPDAAHVGPLFRAELHGRYRIPPLDALAFDLAAALEVAPGERDLVVDEGKSTTTLLSPAVARLRVDIGATFDAF